MMFVVMLVENTVQKKMTMYKRDDRPPHQKSRFFIASKEVALLDIWLSRKAIKGLLQNIYLMLDLYHKRNPFIITVADDSIFSKKI